jgi:hypothetical protein
MVTRCPHGKRVKNFASCEVCNSEINVLAVARLTTGHTRMLSRTVAVGYQKENREWTEIPALNLNKVAP